MPLWLNEFIHSKHITNSFSIKGEEGERKSKDVFKNTEFCLL